MFCSTCFCLFLAVLPSKYVIDIDVRFFDLCPVDYLRNLSEISACLWLWETALISLDIDMNTGEIRMLDVTLNKFSIKRKWQFEHNKWIPFYYSVWVKWNRIWVQVWGESCLAQWHLQGLSGVWWHCGRHLWMYSSSPFRGSTLSERWEIILDHKCTDCNCSNMTSI